MASGMYMPNRCESVTRLMPPSWSLTSICSPVQSFRPSGTMSVKVAVAMSRMATALASCRVTMALVPSGEIAMYSGSTSCDTLRPAKMRTPSARSASSWPLNAVKPAVCTVAAAMPPLMSMMLTEPAPSLPAKPLLSDLAFVGDQHLLAVGREDQHVGMHADLRPSPACSWVAALRKTT